MFRNSKYFSDFNRVISVYFSAFNDFVECKHIYVRKDCGQQAAEFLKKHLDRISNPLIHEHCAHYMYAVNACVTSDISINSPLTNLITILIVLIEIVKRLKNS